MTHVNAPWLFIMKTEPLSQFSIYFSIMFSHIKKDVTTFIIIYEKEVVKSSSNFRSGCVLFLRQPCKYWRLSISEDLPEEIAIRVAELRKVQVFSQV